MLIWHRINNFLRVISNRIRHTYSNSMRTNSRSNNSSRHMGYSNCSNKPPLNSSHQPCTSSSSSCNLLNMLLSIRFGLLGGYFKERSSSTSKLPPLNNSCPINICSSLSSNSSSSNSNSSIILSSLRHNLIIGG